MRKKCYHFFGGLLNAQANWLNKMSEKGYRLIRAGKMLYEFEECKPNEVKYCVEFIGEKSKENAKDYSLFLEDMGYKVFFKNINLNYSVGKVRWRPWAEKGGRIATNTTTFNREFASMRELHRRGKTPDPEHYEVTYYADLPAMWQDVPNNEILEELFQMFNLSRPQDFEGHSLSVSDVIALKRNGEVSVHYVDSIGFKDLQGFLDKQPERPSVLMNLKEKCDAPECNPTVCRKARDEHEL